MYDDIYFIRPFTRKDIKVFYLENVDFDKIPLLESSNTLSEFKTNVVHTFKLLSKYLPKHCIKNYVTHTPHPLNIQYFYDILKKFDILNPSLKKIPIWNVVYHNMFSFENNINTKQIDESYKLGIYSKTNKKIPGPETLILNHDERGLSENKWLLELRKSLI